MNSVKYEFRYMPLIGKLSGESMVRQTETAINEIAKIVNENTAQADIINTLAQDANNNSVEALEKANEALETSSRVYIHESLAVNLDSYCESQLIYVANISSTNLPIAKKGFLEVKTDDDKTECVQLFVSDDKDVYVRSGSITAEPVGDVTVYTADFEEWTSLSSPTILLQAGNGTSISLSADLNDYNTEGTFYCSTTNVGSIVHCPVSEGEFKLIVMKFATANYGLQMLYPIGKHLYVRKYSGSAWGNWEVIVPKITSGITNGSIAVNDTDVAVTGWNTKADLDSPVFIGTPTAPTPASSDNSTKIATTKFVNAKAGNYLPLSGGTVTGGLTVEGTITGNLAGNAALATAATKLQPRGVSGHEKYIFYGTLTIPQDGSFFKLEVLGGRGYTSNVDQSREGTLYFRAGNGNPANYAAYSEYHRNGASNFEFFVVKDSGTQYRIYSGRIINTGTMQVIPYVGQDSSFELALTTVSALPDGAVEVEHQQLIYADTVNNYALPKNGTAVKATSDAAGNNIQNTYAKKSDLSSAAPTGVVQAFAGSTTPRGWLLCDGSAVSRTNYAALYAVIGTTYGAGNGSTTFNLPNLVDKFVEGSATAGTVKSAGLPNITGVVWINGGKSSTNNGAIKYTAQQGGGGIDNPNTGTGSFNLNASRSSSIYGNSTTVQPPALTMRYIIKY